MKAHASNIHKKMAPKGAISHSPKSAQRSGYLWRRRWKYSSVLIFTEKPLPLAMTPSKMGLAKPSWH